MGKCYSFPKQLVEQLYLPYSSLNSEPNLVRGSVRFHGYLARLKDSHLRSTENRVDIHHSPSNLASYYTSQGKQFLRQEKIQRQEIKPDKHKEKIHLKINKKHSTQKLTSFHLNI